MLNQECMTMMSSCALAQLTQALCWVRIPLKLLLKGGLLKGGLPYTKGIALFPSRPRTCMKTFCIGDAAFLGYQIKMNSLKVSLTRSRPRLAESTGITSEQASIEQCLSTVSRQRYTTCIAEVAISDLLEL